MHAAQRHFYSELKLKFPEAFTNTDVLEIGSLYLNGTIRDFFFNCNYIGVDVAHGPCVDVVAFGENLTYPDESFSHVTSSEVMEHCVAWKKVFTNMHRMTRKNGLVSFTCAWGPADNRVGKGRAEHGTSRSEPSSSPLTIALGIEYYENLNATDFQTAFKLDEMFLKYRFFENEIDKDLYFYGIKK